MSISKSPSKYYTVLTFSISIFIILYELWYVSKSLLIRQQNYYKRNTQEITIFSHGFACLTIMFYTNNIFFSCILVCTNRIFKRRFSSITLKHHVIRQLFNIIQASRQSLNTQIVCRNVSKWMIEHLRLFNILLCISFKIFKDFVFTIILWMIDICLRCCWR